MHDNYISVTLTSRTDSVGLNIQRLRTYHSMLYVIHLRIICRLTSSPNLTGKLKFTYIICCCNRHSNGCNCSGPVHFSCNCLPSNSPGGCGKYTENSQQFCLVIPTPRMSGGPMWQVKLDVKRQATATTEPVQLAD